MMITEQKFTGFHVSLRMVFSADTYKFGSATIGVFTICLFIIFFFGYCLGGMIGHGWESCHFIFYAFAIYLFGGDHGLLGRLFISSCTYFF